MSAARKGMAEKLMALLQTFPEVKGCTLYGSLAEGRGDALSDIDIEVDVSGTDNGAFALMLPDRLAQHIPVFYSDYAPSLAPQQYVVTLALDENDPFLFADLRCAATPHCAAVTPAQLKARNTLFAHTLKLWTANLKHYARGVDCTAEICRMGRKLGLAQAEEKEGELLLEETLDWLDENAPQQMKMFLASCRVAFARLTR